MEIFLKTRFSAVLFVFMQKLVKTSLLFQKLDGKSSCLFFIGTRCSTVPYLSHQAIYDYTVTIYDYNYSKAKYRLQNVRHLT